VSRRLLRVGTVGIGAALLASLPLWGPRFWIYVATQALVFAIFAMSLDLLLGYAGLPSFGHAAFYGLGAYACALLAVRRGIPELVPLLLGGGLVAAAAALPIGALSLRSTGVYFLMVTLAFAQMLWGLAVNWRDFTRGDDGIIGVPRPTIFHLEDSLQVSFYERGAFLELVLALALVSLLSLWLITRSPFGRTLEGIRENEHRMRALGCPTFRYRLAAFVIAAALAGMAGALAVLFDGYATPDLLYWTGSGLVLVAVIVGGSRSLVGPALGAFFVVLSRIGLSGYTERWELLVGAAFIAVVLFLPGGIVGLARRAI